MLRKAIFASVFVMAANGFIGTAHADEVLRDTTTLRIAVSEATDPRAVDELHRNISRESSRMCNKLARKSGTVDQSELRRCRAEAVDTAVTNSGLPTLSALHDALPQRQRYAPGRAPASPAVLAAARAATPVQTASVED